MTSSARQVGGMIEIALVSRAPVFPESHLAHLFDPMFADMEEGGWGLSISQSIALQHGGAIRAQKLDDGPGLKFVVALPTQVAELVEEV